MPQGEKEKEETAERRRLAVERQRVAEIAERRAVEELEREDEGSTHDVAHEDAHTSPAEAPHEGSSSEHARS